MTLLKYLPRNRWLSVFYIVAILFMGLCLGSVTAWAARIQVQDSTGATLVFDQPPQRIVSLVPTASEILVTIGAEELVKGATYHDVTLSGSDQREVVGGFFNPSCAHVKQVHPDLLIAASFHSQIIEDAKKSGLKVFVYDTNSLAQVWIQMKTLSRITGHEAEASTLVKKNIDGMAHVQAKLTKAKVNYKRVMRFMGRDSIMTPGADTFQAEMIRAAGGQVPNFGKTDKIVPVSLEAWTRFNPQVIYGCGDDKQVAEKFFSTPGWKDVDAVKNHHIYYLPCDLTCRASVHTSDFVAYLSSLIYTQEFADEKNDVHLSGIIDETLLEQDLSKDFSYVKKAALINAYVFDYPNKTLAVDLTSPMTVLSSLEGRRDNITTVGNHYTPPPTWMPGHLAGINALRTRILDAICKKAETTALLMTGADMGNLSIRTEKFKEMKVTALVTAGVMSNAVRMGTDEGMFYEPGTINILILTNMHLTPRAMSRAIISATEAKTALLEDLDIRSSVSGATHPATGTGTDNILVVAGQGAPIDNAGGHSKMGELIAKAVYAGIKEAVEKQNGILAGRHVIQRLKERNISIYELTIKAQFNCGQKKSEFNSMVEHLLLNKEISGFMESALALNDAYERGQVKNIDAFGLWCEQMAGKIAGQPIEIMDLTRDDHVPIVIKKALNAVMTGAKARIGEENE
ncbi:helical backbone metal receptor [Desulfobacter postgatei]|uniref:helical backbone metal receptor n=1 Tax=Desulfobacter postgatei TaxID=2293 RepID=UPI002A35FB2D|nr:helical backbone metal receptor [Desulfobacter postgatei]MDX9963147.1 helical backbone metal receptor [Desulfobacter postgatei]